MNLIEASKMVASTLSNSTHINHTCRLLYYDASTNTHSHALVRLSERHHGTDIERKFSVTTPGGIKVVRSINTNTDDPDAELLLAVRRGLRERLPIDCEIDEYLRLLVDLEEDDD